MEIVLDKIYATSDRAIADLQKITMNSWTMANVHTIKHVLDRLRLCFDEFHFHLQKKNLKDEANLVQRLSQHLFTIFEKIEEVNQKKVTNPIDMPIEYCFKPPNIISQKTLFGGAEVQAFSIYSKQQAKLLSAEPEYRATKQRKIRNVQTKGTDTNEDAFVLLQGPYLSEKEKEIIKLEQENAQNLMELEKHLKMKGMWSELHASNAQHKIQELFRQMEKESYRNELFVNDQLKFQNQQEDEQQKDIKKDLNDKIVTIQRKTADKIIKAADKKMKHEYEKFVLKKTAGILMRKSKQQNYQRLDELEALILTKNEEIFDKEQKMNSLLQKFEQQEKKLGDLAIQIDVYKEHQEIGSFNSHRKNDNSNDIEIQVNITDRRIFTMELQLQEIIQENDQFKSELKLMHQQAIDEKKKTISAPKQIEEIILMILQSDLTPNSKIEAMQTLLQYITDNSEEEFIKMAPNEIFKIVKSRVVVSQRNFEEKNEDFSEEEHNYSQPSLVKKKKKPKIKQSKKGQEKSSDNNDYSIESSENQLTTKIQKKKNNEDLSQDRDADISEYNSNSNININGKKQIKNLYKISEESQHFKNSPRIQLDQAKTPKSKSSNRSTIKGNTKDGYLKVDQNTNQQEQQQSKQQKQQQSQQYNGKSQQFIANNNQTKEASHFKTESQRQVSSGSRLNPMSRQTHSRQESLQQQNSIKDLSQLQKKGESQTAQNINISSQNQQLIQNQILSKQTSNYNNSEYDEIDCEQISEQQFSKGIQVSMNQNLMNQSQQCIESQKNLSRLGSQLIPSADQTVSHTPIAKSKIQEVEKFTAKYSQTDDFFLFHLFQKMAADIGLSEDQLKRLSQIFLNEQQFVHYYEKEGPTYFMQQLQQQTLSQQQQQQQNSMTANVNNKSLSRASSLIMDKDGRFIELQRSESVKLGQSNTQKNDTSPDYSEMNKQQRISILRSQQKSQQSPTQKNQILLSYTNESSIQINQHRSVSQNSDVHIMNYGPVSPENKQKRASQSQRILEEMLKNKSTIASPKEAEVREQKLYFSIFGDEMQNDTDFEMEAVRNNLGRPLEVVQDHMKEEAIKRIFTQFATRAKNQWQEQIYMVISQFANKPIQSITYVDFKKYYENYMRVHKRCGDGCIHIQRFLARVGFGINSRRKQLNMSKASLSPFGQLPKLK